MQPVHKTNPHKSLPCVSRLLGVCLNMPSTKQVHKSLPRIDRGHARKPNLSSSAPKQIGNKSCHPKLPLFAPHQPPHHKRRASSDGFLAWAPSPARAAGRSGHHPGPGPSVRGFPPLWPVGESFREPVGPTSESPILRETYFFQENRHQ